MNPAASTGRDFRVTDERRADARRSRRTIVFTALGLLALAAVTLVLFPPGQGTRTSLSVAALVLAALSALLLIRLALIVKRAEACVGATGSVLLLSDEGITVADEAFVPWQAVSGVWGLDSGPGLRARAQKSVFGAPGRVMLRAGTNTANITIGVVDFNAIRNPHARAKRFAQLPSGLTPARLELAFGSQFGSAELHQAFATMRAALPPTVPVRLCSGAFDYAAAWSGTADDVATIQKREAAHSS